MPRVGIIPAAGSASRISPLPCSKEIYPLGFMYGGPGGGEKPRVACHDLLEGMAAADVDRAYVVIRSGKWDIPAYLGGGESVGIKLAYVVTGPTSGAPFTIDNALPFVQDALIFFGFPDILFDPKDAFVRLADRQRETGADVVLGLYRARFPNKMDMVGCDAAGRVREIIIKPLSTDLTHAWIMAVWTGAFTRFMHEFLRQPAAVRAGADREIFVGDVFRAWMQKGHPLETVTFSNGYYIDIGTPGDLNRAVKKALLIQNRCGNPQIRE